MVAKIPLTRGFFALVDDEDAERVLSCGHKWSAKPDRNTIYAMYKGTGVDGKRPSVYLHRFILNAPKGSIVDHINRDGLDCRKENLRYVTHGQNVVNRTIKPKRSGYLGVSMRKNRPAPYRVTVTKDGKSHYCGSYACAEDAARIYDVEAIAVHGEFARTNFPLEDYIG